MPETTIGALFFSGFEMLDIYGPLEMFSMHRDDFAIVAVAEHHRLVPASGGPATQPDADFAEDRAFDLVIVPGGQGVRQEKDNPVLLDWLRRQAESGALMASVCTGSALFAVAGLLDGRRATTNKLAFDWVAGLRPEVDWQRQARWVRDGDVVTASGVSAGMDMALAVIADLRGAKTADEAALWAEYTPNTDPDTDPFARSPT